MGHVRTNAPCGSNSSTAGMYSSDTSTLPEGSCRIASGSSRWDTTSPLASVRVPSSEPRPMKGLPSGRFSVSVASWVICTGFALAGSTRSVMRWKRQWKGAAPSAGPRSFTASRCAPPGNVSMQSRPEPMLPRRPWGTPGCTSPERPLRSVASPAIVVLPMHAHASGAGWAESPEHARPAARTSAVVVKTCMEAKKVAEVCAGLSCRAGWAARPVARAAPRGGRFGGGNRRNGEDGM